MSANNNENLKATKHDIHRIESMFRHCGVAKQIAITREDAEFFSVLYCHNQYTSGALNMSPIKIFDQSIKQQTIFTSIS